MPPTPRAIPLRPPGPDDPAQLARRAAILVATSRSLAAIDAPARVFEGIERVALQQVGADGFTVYHVDARTRTGAVRQSRGLGTEITDEAADSLWEGHTGIALANRRAVFLQDLAALGDEALTAPLRATRDLGVRAIAFLPLQADDALLGLLVLRWRTAQPVDAAEHQLLRDFAALVALALRNAALLQDLDRRATRLTSVARLQEAMSRQQRTDVYSEVQRVVATAIPGISIIALALVDAEGTTFLPQLVVVQGVSTAAPALPGVPVGDCGASRAVRTRAPQRSDRPLRVWSDVVAGRARRARVHSEVAVPILHGDAVLGALVVQGDAPDAFSPDDAALLGIIGRQAGAAIENARLFEAERTERALAEATAAIARAALTTTSPFDAGAEILAAVDRVVPSGGMALGLAAGDGAALTYVAATGRLAALRGRVLPREAGAMAAAEGTDAPFAPAVERLGEGDVVPPGATLAPLAAKGRLVGVLWSTTLAGPRARLPEAFGRAMVSVALAADVLVLGEEEHIRRERERTLAAALATMDQPVLILGLDRRVWYANEAAVREYGYPADAWPTLAVDTLVASSVPARRIEASPATSSSVWMAEHIHRRQDGSQFPASVMLGYIRDDDGAPIGQVMNVRNLTAERRLAEQLRQSEKLAALGELVAGVAHEVNNPLAGISAFAQLLLDEALTPEQLESARLIKREADRASGVIRDLLLFARKTDPSLGAVDLNALVELTLRLRGFALRGAGIEVVTELAPDLPPVHGDRERLQQVLLNLIVNAEDAMRERPVRRLLVRTASTPEGVLASIADTGDGIAEEARERIFEPFFTTKPAGQGTGLGLSVSYGIVQAHGGTIRVESEPGHGATFHLVLRPAGATAPTPTAP